jgi:hypothetical protein
MAAKTAVDFAIAIAAMLLEPASVTVAVREAKLAFCAPELAVIPLLIVTVQGVSASMSAAAVSVSVAEAPEPLAATANVVVPQPLFEGDERDANVKSGRTKAISSPDVIFAFNVKWYDTEVSVDTFGIAKASTSFDTIGARTPVDVTIGLAPMSVAPASVAVIVRVLSLAFWEDALVVMPVAIVTVQAVCAAIEADVAVRTTLAAAPEPNVAAVNAVDPHPLDDGDARVPSVKSGTAKVIVSDVASSAVKANRRETDVIDAVTGVANTRELWLITGATMAVEDAIGVAVTSGEFARVRAAVRVFRFPAWGELLVVTPVAIVTSQVENAVKI